MRDIAEKELLEAAVGATQAAGGHALRHWSRRDEVIATFAHDVKLALDVECQQQAESYLRARFPGHLILGEESAPRRDPRPRDVPYEWIIDPIDGTVNFAHGLPFWCCSIAVRHGAEVLAGAVYAPVIEESYTAARHEAARCNGRELRVSAIANLPQSVIMTGLDKGIDPRQPPFEVFRAISAAVQKARIMGVAALDLCRVAAGQAEGYFENGIYLWDIAAAGLIVERAGGQAELLAQLDGERLRFLATNGRIHAALKQVIQRSLSATA